MADITPLSENLSAHLFEQVTVWRNDHKEDNMWTTFGKRLVTELTYAFLPFLSTIEAAFRAVIALSLRIAACCMPEEKREWIIEKSEDFKKNAFSNILVAGASVIGLGHNFTKDEIKPREMVDIFCCGRIA